MSSTWHALHAQLCRSTERLVFQKQYQAIRASHPDLAELTEIASLIDHQHDPGGDPARKDRVLRALTTTSRTKAPLAETAQVLAILALWPGLDAIRCRQARHFGAERDRLSAELVGRLSLAIATADLSRINRLAATLLRNVERDLRRMLKAAWQRNEDMLRDDLANPDAPGWSDHVGNLPVAGPSELIGRLRGVIGADAALVVAVSVLGLSQKEAAVGLGLSHDGARKRYQRAMARLKRTFRDED